MKPFYKINFFAFFAFICSVSFAQTKDSIKQKTAAFITDKFPNTRVLNIEFTQLTPYKYSLENKDGERIDGKMNNFSQVMFNSNLTFIKKEKWTFGTTLNFKYISTDNETIDVVSNEKNSVKEDFKFHSTWFNFTYFSKLFNKPAFYSSSLIFDGSEQHFERIRGMLTGTLLLKANARSKMTLGLVVMIDPSVQTPIIPIFTYEYKFQNGWIADIILPKRILMKKNIFENGRISFGSELDGTSFYLYDASKRFEYRQIDINSGLIYEHYLGNSFIATFKTGMRNTPNGRLFEKNESFNDYLLESKPKASYYFNVGVSFNPFQKFKK